MTTNTLAAVPQAEKRASALAVMAEKINVEPAKLLAILKETVFKKATDNELAALVIVSNEYGLNPLLKEIYAFPAKGGGIVPVVSIDGWISMINRQPQLDGLTFDFKDTPEGKAVSCTCTIFVKGRSHPVILTEYLEECYRNTEPWNMMPRRMLRHKALIQAGRVAFGFAGIQDEDEANDTIKRANAREVKSTPARPDFTAEAATDVDSDTTVLEETPEPGPDSGQAPDEYESTAYDVILTNLADQGATEIDLCKVLKKKYKISVASVRELTLPHAESVLSMWGEISEELSK